jgi:hypothetical protein
MSADSEKAKKFMPQMPERGKVDLTIVETADMTMVLKALIEQNQRLLMTVDSILHSQTMEKACDRQYRLERERRQDGMMDTIKELLPRLVDYLKPIPPPPSPWSPHFEATPDPLTPKAPYKRRARR